MMSNNIEGKVVIITGARSGLGEGSLFASCLCSGRSLDRPAFPRCVSHPSVLRVRIFLLLQGVGASAPTFRDQMVWASAPEETLFFSPGSAGVQFLGINARSLPSVIPSALSEELS